ncbi:MAG: trypsin-like serine protease [Gemmatimonadetes bacterium]|nr:trypsin-like serine protease [Gemmatimonadota bacterium]
MVGKQPLYGGACFGDSGGPNFLGDTHVVVGVSSFALNRCAERRTHRSRRLALRILS